MTNREYILTLPQSLVEKALKKKLPCILCVKYRNKTCNSNQCRKYINQFLHLGYMQNFDYANLIENQLKGNEKYE